MRITLILAVLALALVAGPSPLRAAEPDRAAAAARAAALVAELALACPEAGLDDEAAFRGCADGLQQLESDRLFKDIVLWGGEKPGVRLAEAHLTQFGGPAWVRLYLPTFIVAGAAAPLVWDETHGLFRLSIPARFRGELAPGQFPYPFWHSSAKWDAYLKNERLDFMLAPDDGRVAVIFRQPGNTAIGDPARTGHAFTTWMWRDDSGQLQPVVTLFDGYFRKDNPELARLDETYRAMAEELRRTECLSCHVPDNPNGMRKLVILQTPAHAADQIDRVIESVTSGRMPVTLWGTPQRLGEADLAAFMAPAGAFQQAVAAARAWEKANPR